MQQELLADVVCALKSIAPEVDETMLVADQPLRDQIDLDALDRLNFLIALRQKLQIDIPESDYAKLSSLNDLLGYLRAKMAC